VVFLPRKINPENRALKNGWSSTAAGDVESCLVQFSGGFKKGNNYRPDQKRKEMQMDFLENMDVLI
jgi:hypothetical protein